MFKIVMRYYVTKTKDGLYHIQNAVMGNLGQHHIHNEKSFNKWKKDIDPVNIKISEGKCDCGLDKVGTVREYDGTIWFNDKFL